LIKDAVLEFIADTQVKL